MWVLGVIFEQLYALWTANIAVFLCMKNMSICLYLLHEKTQTLIYISSILIFCSVEEYSPDTQAVA